MQNGVKKITSSFGVVSNHLKIRSSIIKEIVNSETEYVELLKFVVNVMKPSLEFCAEQIEYEIEDGHIRALFSNIGDLLEVHQSLLTELKKEVEKYNSDSSIYTEEEQSLQLCKACLGRIFVDLKNGFRVYDIYCSNHSRAVKVTEDVLKMTSLQSVVKKWNENLPFSKDTLKGSSTLDYCLKEPLLHMCKATVLMKALSVFTMINQDDLYDVLSAYSILHATINSIESEQRQELLAQAYNLLEVIQQKWDKKSFLNKDGFLTKRGGNIRSWKIRWFTVRGYEMKYFDEPVDERALGVLNLKECSRVFEADSQSKPNCFGLTLPDRTYYIYATTPYEMTEWTHLVAWKVYMLKSAEDKARLTLNVPPLGQSLSVLSLLHFK